MFYNFSNAKTTRLSEVCGGVLIGIIGSYLFVYAPEILQGKHYLDLNFMAQLLLLGALVIAFGYWRSTTKTIA